MKTIKIGERVIEKGSSPFVIAEAGVSHNGQLDLAFDMIKAAKKAGADAVKFQTFKSEEFVADPHLTYQYQSQGKEVSESMLAMFKRFEFDREQWKQIKQACDRERITFISTPQNRSDLDLLLELGVPAIKIGSDDLTNTPLIRDYASTGLPIILSAGMADLGDIHAALKALGSFDGYPTILLHCTSQYPTPPEDVNLEKIRSLQATFGDLLIGFSDHSQGSLASSLAVSLGAVLLEKHFTMSRDLPGPDHWFSEDPQSLAEWVSAIRLSHTMMGSGILRPTAEEEKLSAMARRSIVTLRAIKKGERLGHENIGLKRPGKGLPPSMLERVQGLKALKDLDANQPLMFGDFG